jgi:hypothetical protein
VSYLPRPVFVQRRVPGYLGCGCRRGLGDVPMVDDLGNPIVDPSTIPGPSYPANLPNPVISGGAATSLVAAENWFKGLFAPGSSVSDVLANATGTVSTPNQVQNQINAETKSCIGAGGSPATCAAQARADQTGIAAITSKPGAFPTTEPPPGTMPTWAWVLIVIGGFVIIRDVL